MTPTDDWTPDPALLAAYFDGELGAWPDAETLRRRLVLWLRSHPEAREVFADYRRLRALWRDSSPPDPGPAVWDEIATQLDMVVTPHGRGRRWGVAALAATAAVVLITGLALGSRLMPGATQARGDRPVPAEADLEVLPVATAAEIVILRVEGADTQTLVVGELPVGGPLELAGPGDVVLTSVQPDARDQMLPHVRMAGPRPPLIWARVEPESMEP